MCEQVGMLISRLHGVHFYIVQCPQQVGLCICVGHNGIMRLLLSAGCYVRIVV